MLRPAGLAADALLPSAAQAAPGVERYERLQLLKPHSDETVHDNSGRVPVEIDLRPRLDTKAGQRIRVILDGSLLPGSWSSPRFALQGVDRGRHALQVVVTDAKGRRLAQSEPVSFNMWQASRMLPGRGSTP